MNRTAWGRGCFPLVLLSACAISQQDNRRTLNAMDAHLAPASTTARAFLVPLALPAGVLGLAADAAVVHPCCVLDDAWGDTAEFLWERQDESPFRTAVMAPLRALATPVVFGADWLARALLPIGPRKDKQDKQAEEDS